MDNQEELGNSIMTLRYKLVFVGDISVGKTAVVNRFIKSSYSGDYDVNKKLIFLNINL
jgi:GTPase SAR1 family protein